MEKGKERGEFFLREERIGAEWKVVFAGEAGESKSGGGLGKSGEIGGLSGESRERGIGHGGEGRLEELVLAAKGGEGR
jgi:hypothetical protein